MYIKKILILLPFFFITNFLTAELIDKKDITKLNKEDKKLFFKKCLVDEIYLSSPGCVNYLGIKIFIAAYNNEAITNSMFEEVTQKSVKYLKYAANKGNKDSYINLAWIFSINKSSFYSLKQSAEYYKKAYLKDTEVLESNILKPKEYKGKSANLNYSNIKLSIVLIEKLEIYFSHSKKKVEYISREDFKKANMIYNKIISKSYIKKDDLDRIKKKVNKDNKIIISFLKDDLKTYNKKYKGDAASALKKLERLYKKLN